MKRDELQRLVQKVASEVWSGFNSHPDPKQKPANGTAKSVVFDILSESLRGMKVKDLNPANAGSADDFVSRVNRAFTDNIRTQQPIGQTLHCLAIRPQVIGGTYTGVITLDDEIRII